ncbi:MAG: peptidase U62 [Deltaproteobacteria bacterium]|nr:peptidase U62 [Deltaproteobacteria bacterium]
MRFRSGILLAVVGLLPITAVAAEPPDPLMDSLAAEAKRASDTLSKAPDAPLYYLSYRVRDGASYELSASFGAMSSAVDADDPLSGRMRVLDVSTRVGSPQLDNTHKLRGGYDFGGYRRATQLPIDDDAAALRLAMWQATDHAYQSAVKQLIRVRANKTVKVAEADEADDFDTEPPQVHLEPRKPQTLDRKAWAARLKKLSALFKDHPSILHSQVSLSGYGWNNYFVDTAGARIREPQSFARLMISASTKAADGMELDLYKDFEAVTAAQLPSDKELEASIKDLVSKLEALRVAPVVDPYSGPAIVTNRAAAVFFHEIFGHRVEGHRQKDADEGHTFTHKVGQPVLPAFLSVVDDPTRTRFGETLLNGHYLYDDDGVPAQAAPLVENGVLKGFLMGRSPIAGFPHSNGHGRAMPGLATVARQGNLIVTSTKKVPFAELRKQLIDEVKKQKKPYGLIFDDISGGFTQTRAEMTPQAFKVLPLIVRRVYPDGRPDELVRGVNLIGTPLESFEKILATGDDDAVFNGYCGAESGFVPVAAVAPSLLLGEIEVERQTPNHERLPILPPPLHPNAPWDEGVAASTTPATAVTPAAAHPGGK